jgi:unsaturated chondroitin disaccharide hydrolase
MNSSEQKNATDIRACAAPEQETLRRVFSLCVRKTRHNIKRLADQPKSCAWAVDGNYFDFQEGFYEIGNWTSSFFTGMALLACRETEDEYFLQQVLRLAPYYRDKVFTHYADTMHDLGFLYSLYSVALYKLTGNKTHREVALRAADVLAKRFIPTGGFIRAWGRMDDADPHTADMAIIDCMMNLPLLHWAAAETGDDNFRNIATRHADTTSKQFIRSDDSVYHAYRFDLATGRPLRGDTYGGCAVESHWARGTAWAIYGYALSYGYTRNAQYMDAALRLARRFIGNLNGNTVPGVGLQAARKPEGHSRLIRGRHRRMRVAGVAQASSPRHRAHLRQGSNARRLVQPGLSGLQ